MKNFFGVMQGRLLPKYNGRYQAHPKGYWADEFKIAQNLGLDCIEFILDFEDANENPLLNADELIKLQSTISETGVKVRTICADYFMEAPLHSKDRLIAENSLSVLRKLLESAKKLDVSDIVMPCVDQSSLENSEVVNRFVRQVTCMIPDLEEKDVNLSLETDLGPIAFAELLSMFDSKKITVNYDIGNSASLGFCPVEELDSFGDRISDIHIKDRILNGGPVVLGRGNADFDLFFDKLSELDYKGPFIMQAYRDDEGLCIFREQKEWIQKKYLAHL